MGGFPQSSIDFLVDLSENNTKEWFQANKKRYEAELKKPARALMAEVNEQLLAISPDHARDVPHKALNRINRDIRFSKDKTPYNTRVWGGFHNQARPKGGGAGYFVGISPDGVGIGCGCWAPPKEYMVPLRQHIAANHADLTGAMAALPDSFGEVRGDKYKRVPKPWDSDHPAGELLKHKGLHWVAELPLEVGLADDFVSVIADHFRALQPIVQFLDDGLAG